MARPLNAGVAGPMTGQMEGLMMVTPLTLGELIIPRAEELFGHRAVIARVGDGVHRTTWAETCVRARQVVVLPDLAADDRAAAQSSDLDYEELVAAAEPLAAWPQVDENAAAAMCYTSGTTGNPKGVVYSHRSTVLHSLAVGLADAQ